MKINRLNLINSFLLFIEKESLLKEYKQLESKFYKSKKDLKRMKKIRMRMGELVIKVPFLFK